MTHAAAALAITEEALQRQVVHLFTIARCEIYDTSQGYRAERGGTRMTPGLADLVVFLPPGTTTPPRAIGFFEVKTPAGLALHRRMLDGSATGKDPRKLRRALAQETFARHCRTRLIPYGMGGMDEAFAFLAAVGLADSLPTGGYQLRRTP